MSLRTCTAITAMVLLAGCAGVPDTRVVRVLGGERRAGVYVSPFAYEWFVRGELAYARGDLERAVEAFELARTGPEDDPLVIARLAEVLEELGRSRRADRMLAEGLELDPRSEAVWLAKGQIAEGRGEMEEAIGAYERAARFAPRSSAGPVAAARLLAKRGATARAEQILRRESHRRDPTASRVRLEIALARRDARAAVSAVERLLRTAPARMEDIRRAAELAATEGQPLLAARLLDRLPRDATEPAIRVRALLAAGRSAEAEGVLATEPSDVFGGLDVKAKLYLEAGRPARALELAEAAAAFEPSPDAWLVAGQAALVLGRYVEAARWFARVPKGVRAFDEARVGLGRALRAQGLAAVGAEVLAHAQREAPDSRILAEALEAARRAR